MKSTGKGLEFDVALTVLYNYSQIGGLSGTLIGYFRNRASAR